MLRGRESRMVRGDAVWPGGVAGAAQRQHVRAARPREVSSRAALWARECSALAIEPPYRPECRLRFAPLRLNSRPDTPRLAIVIDGSSLRHIAPSADRTESARSISRFVTRNG